MVEYFIINSQHPRTIGTRIHFLDYWEVFAVKDAFKAPPNAEYEHFLETDRLWASKATPQQHMSRFLLLLLLLISQSVKC